MEDWELHTILHVLVPTIIFILSFLYLPEISLLERILAILLGTIFPDLDHLIYLKYIRFKSAKDFLIFNIKSDRYRRGLLIFHNIPFIVFLAILIPIVMFFSTFLALFFLSAFAHLIFDFFEDRILIRTVSHWKFGK